MSRPPSPLELETCAAWRFTLEELRDLARRGRILYLGGSPCPPPACLLRDPDCYYIRLAYLCEAERSKAAVSRMARRAA